MNQIRISVTFDRDESTIRRCSSVSNYVQLVVNISLEEKVDPTNKPEEVKMSGGKGCRKNSMNLRERNSFRHFIGVEISINMLSKK
ncbi:MAG: hypothetical protein ACOC49_02535 [Candidatus Bipolaricaulota bacterium]